MTEEYGEINMEAMNMGARPEQKSITTEAARLAKEHWEWVEGLLKTDPTSRLTIDSAKYLYTSAFAHGWKHAMRMEKPVATGPGEAITI